LLAGCAAQNAYREGQTLLAEEKVDAGLAKIQEAMLLDPSAVEYRIGYHPRPGPQINASLDHARTCASPRAALRRGRSRLPPRCWRCNRAMSVRAPVAADR
jgi:general secretion pathway protein D